MAEEIVIELAKVIREGVARAQQRMRQQQLGACFTAEEQEHVETIGS